MIGKCLGGGRYRVTRVLARGGTSQVLLCDDLRLPGARWVVKLADPTAVPPGVALGPVMHEEARLLARIRHAAVHRVVDQFTDDGTPGLVMDYVPGVNLESRIEQDGPLTEPEALRVADELLSLIEHVHGLEPPVFLVDLHPANILLGPAGSVHVVDLGMAREGPGVARGGREGFAAPEGSVTAASDLYAWGATLHFMLTGARPGGARSRARRGSQATTRLLEDCLAREPASRPSLEQVGRRLRRRRQRGERPRPACVPDWALRAASFLCLISILLLGAGWVAARGGPPRKPYDYRLPDSPQKAAAREALERGDREAALRRLEEAVRQVPSDGEAHILLENTQHPDALEIPCLVSLTGTGRGQDYFRVQGMALAQAELNQEGGVQGRPLALTLFDDASSIEGALESSKSWSAASVPCVLGPGTSRRALALSYVLEQHGLAALSTGGTHPDLWRPGGNVFTVAAPLTVRIGPLADSMLDRGHKKVCLIYAPDEPMSRDLAYFVKERLERGGGSIVEELSYEVDMRDFRSLAPQVRRSGADALFLSVSPGTLVGEFAHDLRTEGVAVPIYSNMIGYDRALVETGGDAVEGMRLVETFHPDSNRPEVRAFVASFKRAFPDSEPTRAAAQGYDAVKVLARLLREVGPDRGRLRSGLAALGAAVPAYEGPSGLVSPGSAVDWEPTYILEVRSGEYRLVEAMETRP